MNTNQKAELRTFAQCYECGAHATLTTIDSQFAWLESHKCPAKPMNTDTNQKAVSIAQRLPAHWHDCEVAEKQILELQRERDQYKAHAERLAEALRKVHAKLGTFEGKCDPNPGELIIEAFHIAQTGLAQYEEAKKQ